MKRWIAVAALLVLLIGPLYAQPPAFSIVHYFGADGVKQPIGGLIADWQGTLYGATGFGQLFAVTPDGQYYWFGTLPHGAVAWQLIQGADGAFYGFTGAQGGPGEIFRIQPDLQTSYETVYTFHGPDGFSPRSLIQAVDGTSFVGTTATGGAFDQGTLFQLFEDGTFVTLHSFGETPTDGRGPTGAIVQAEDGNVYGETGRGGQANHGTLYRMTGDSYTVLHQFTDVEGSSPTGGLMQASDSLLYGTTSFGGPNGWGTFFRLSLDGVYQTVYANPTRQEFTATGPLLEGPDGALYGLQPHTGSGRIYRVTKTGLYTVLYVFGERPDGSWPDGALTLGPDGALYGVATAGGPGGLPGAGDVFRLALP